MMEYKIYGENNPSTLLLVHEALVTQSMWKHQVRFLENNFKVITCNLPEHGSSPTISGAYTVDQCLKAFISDHT